MKTYPYEAMMTPFEKLKPLDNAHQYLKPGITLVALDAIIKSRSNSAREAKILKTSLLSMVFEPQMDGKVL